MFSTFIADIEKQELPRVVKFYRCLSVRNFARKSQLTKIYDITVKIAKRLASTPEEHRQLTQEIDPFNFISPD